MRAFFLVTLIAVSFYSFSQTKTYVGLKMGGHGKSVFVDHTIFPYRFNDAISSGLNAGILIKHFPKRRDIFLNSGIQMGINYVQKGWKQNFNLQGQAVELPKYSVEMNYLELPIEGIGYFGNKNKYFVAVGFYAEYLLGYTKDEQPEFDEGSEELGVPRVNAFNFITYEPARDREIGYGFRASGGIFRDFSFGSLHLEGFFTFSISNVVDAGNLTDASLPDISNHWTSGVAVAYLIPFGKLEMVEK